jgi:hypothetical protein
MGELRAGHSLNEIQRHWRISDKLDDLLGTHNYLDVTLIAHLYDSVPHTIPYKYGATYFTWLTAPIPRVLWPEKPSLNMGVEITELVYGGKKWKGGIEYGTTPAGIIGELILNFGAIGVPFGCLAYGFLIRLLYNSSNQGRPHTPAGKLLYLASMFTITFFGIDAEFSRIMIAVFMNCTTAVIFMVCVGQTPRPAGATGPRAASRRTAPPRIEPAPPPSAEAPSECSTC